MKLRQPASKGDVRQVINNLVGNAIDSMRTGGRLIIRARKSSRWNENVPEDLRESLRISVADSGGGIFLRLTPPPV